MDIVNGILPLAYVMTSVMVALATLSGFENDNAGADSGLAQPLNSQSCLLVPFFLLAALTLLLR